MHGLTAEAVALGAGPGRQHGRLAGLAPHPGAGQPPGRAARRGAGLRDRRLGAEFGLKPDPSDTGYGHSTAEVAEVAPASAQVLLDYYQAVHDRTVAYVSGLTGRRPGPGGRRALGSAGHARRTPGQRHRRRRAARGSGGLRTRSALIRTRGPVVHRHPRDHPFFRDDRHGRRAAPVGRAGYRLNGRIRMTTVRASQTAVIVCQGRAARTSGSLPGRFADPVALPLLRDDERELVRRSARRRAAGDWRHRMAYEMVRALGRDHRAAYGRDRRRGPRGPARPGGHPRRRAGRAGLADDRTARHRDVRGRPARLPARQAGAGRRPAATGSRISCRWSSAATTWPPRSRRPGTAPTSRPPGSGRASCPT